MSVSELKGRTRCYQCEKIGRVANAQSEAERHGRVVPELCVLKPSEGMALLHTHAQHGLVGSRTLHGLRVEYSSEDGGSER